jgi:hypothetical protein
MRLALLLATNCPIVAARRDAVRAYFNLELARVGGKRQQEAIPGTGGVNAAAVIAVGFALL